MSESRRSTVRRRAFLAAAAASAAALLAACGGSSDGAPATSGGASSAANDLSGVTIRVGQTLWPSTKTQFELAGLDKVPYTIEWSIFPGGDKQLQALGAGALDVASTSDIPPIFARAGNNSAFKVVAVQQGTTLLQEVLASKQSGITSIAGLKGKKVAFVQATTAQYFLAKVLAEAGLSFADIEAVPLAPADGATALASGKVDALASYGPSLQLLREQGAVQIGSGKDILSGNFPISVATSALSDPKKTAAVVDYLSRLNKAQAWVRDNPDAYVAKQVTFTKQTPAAALQILTEGEQQRPTKIVPVSPEAIAKQQDVADTFVTLGVLKAKVDVAAYWSDELSTQLSALASS